MTHPTQEGIDLALVASGAFRLMQVAASIRIVALWFPLVDLADPTGTIRCDHQESRLILRQYDDEVRLRTGDGTHQVSRRERRIDDDAFGGSNREPEGMQLADCAQQRDPTVDSRTDELRECASEWVDHRFHCARVELIGQAAGRFGDQSLTSRSVIETERRTGDGENHRDRGVFAFGLDRREDVSGDIDQIRWRLAGAGLRRGVVQEQATGMTFSTW